MLRQKELRKVGKKRAKAIEKKAEKLNLFNEAWCGTPELNEEDGTSPVTEEELPEFSTMIEQVVERDNMLRAYKRVVKNKGSAGVDGVSVEELVVQVKRYWPAIKEALLKGSYKPQAVRIVTIPKASGGTRQLGIPTVMDRLIQQAVLQKLSPKFDSTFSESSYGFRPGKSAHMAIKQAQTYQRTGKRWVVDLDLENFFDEVNHARLMSRIGQVITDDKVLTLIRRYLQSGVMVGGVPSQRTKGTPQGSPLSPHLSNIVLDELDRELERRNLSFCRYADDCNIYVRSQKAGERVKESMQEFIEEKLRLRVNEKKSAVARTWKRRFLGYSFSMHKQAKIIVPKETECRFKQKLKQLFRKGRGRNIGTFIRESLTPVLRGWIGYYHLAEFKAFVERLDEWIRRRLRVIIWRQWKRPRTRLKKLLSRGLDKKRALVSAYNGRGAWWNSGASHMNHAIPIKYFRACGLLSLHDRWRKYKQ